VASALVCSLGAALLRWRGPGGSGANLPAVQRAASMTLALGVSRQGSQKLGMAEGLLELPLRQAAAFAIASKLLWRDLVWRSCSGSVPDSPTSFPHLNGNPQHQPALFVVVESLAWWMRLLVPGRTRPKLDGAATVLGGIEWALYAAGVFDVATGCRLDPGAAAT